MEISKRRTFHKALVLCITFIAYTCYHMGRRPLSIVKNVLNRNCSNINPSQITNFNNNVYLSGDLYQFGDNNDNSTWCDWPPFDNDATANQLLALLDSAFLFSYAIFMFFSGFLADRCNLKYFLSAGMLLSGLLLYAFGLSYYLDIHSMTYFVIIQILSGAIQTTGWPTVVTCIGNWFDTNSRGAIFGLWNSNTNLGNILGAAIAGYFVEKSWGLSFMVPGFIMMIGGVLVFLFLVPKPEDVGLLSINDLKKQAEDIPRNHYDSQHHHQDNLGNGNPEIDSQISNNSENSPLINNNDDNDNVLVTSDTNDHNDLNNHQIHQVNGGNSQTHAVSFYTCLKIPGVIEYSMCLGFAKLVSYTFLYWLPRYITQSTTNNSEQSAYLSVPFDIGGIVGAVIAGVISDKYKKSAITCTVMLILAIPSMLIYEKFAAISNFYNIVIQLLVGALVTGPYALITTAVSTDLGSRIKDGKSMATVAAIIDGTGSIGAAIGPLFAGYVSDSGWQTVFVMLMLSDLIASMCLTRITLKELGFR